MLENSRQEKERIEKEMANNLSVKLQQKMYAFDEDDFYWNKTRIFWLVGWSKSTVKYAYTIVIIYPWFFLKSSFKPKSFFSILIYFCAFSITLIWINLENAFFYLFSFIVCFEIIYLVAIRRESFQFSLHLAYFSTFDSIDAQRQFTLSFASSSGRNWVHNRRKVCPNWAWPC